MPLLIDCYNVLHCAMPAMLAGLDVDRLCRSLSQTHWAKSGSITVVADGRPNPLGTPTSPVPEVELVYAGGGSSGGRSADDVIIARIEASKSPRRLTVVSSDREIRAAARHRRCTAWSSEDFLSRLCGQLRRQSHHVAKSRPRPKQPRPLGVGRTMLDGIPADQALRWLREMGVADVPDPTFQALADTPTIRPEQLGIDLHLEDALEHLADLDMDEVIKRFGQAEG
ncbi:MAG: NYN domain-containing protein [Planctomycetota bacterium]